MPIIKDNETYLTPEEAYKLGLMEKPYKGEPEKSSAIEVLAKQILSGATLGHYNSAEAPNMPEDIKQAKEETWALSQQEHPYASIAGRMIGEAIPLTALSEVVAPIEGLNVLSKAPSLVKRMTQSAALGGAYGALRKKEESESLPEAMAKDAAYFTLFDLGLHGAGKILKSIPVFKGLTKAKIAEANPEKYDLLNGVIDTYTTKGKEKALAKITELKDSGKIDDKDVKSLLENISQLEAIPKNKNIGDVQAKAMLDFIDNLKTKGYSEKEAHGLWERYLKGEISDKDVESLILNKSKEAKNAKEIRTKTKKRSPQEGAAGEEIQRVRVRDNARKNKLETEATQKEIKAQKKEINPYEELASNIKPENRENAENAVIEFAAKSDKNTVDEALNYFDKKIEEAKASKDFTARSKYVYAKDMLKQASGRSNAPEHVRLKVEELRKKYAEKPEIAPESETKAKPIETTPKAEKPVERKSEAEINEDQIKKTFGNKYITNSKVKSSTVKFFPKSDVAVKLKDGSLSNGYWVLKEEFVNKKLKERFGKKDIRNIDHTLEKISPFEKNVRPLKEIGEIEGTPTNEIVFVDNDGNLYYYDKKYIDYLKRNIKDFNLKAEDNETAALIYSGNKKAGALMPIRNYGDRPYKLGEPVVELPPDIHGKEYVVPKKMNDTDIESTLKKFYDYLPDDKELLEPYRNFIDRLNKKQKEKYKSVINIINHRIEKAERRKADLSRVETVTKLSAKGKATPASKKQTFKEFVESKGYKWTQISGKNKNEKLYSKLFDEYNSKSVKFGKEAGGLATSFPKPKVETGNKLKDKFEEKKIYKTLENIVDVWFKGVPEKIQTKVKIAKNVSEFKQNVINATKQIEEEIKWFDKHFTKEQALKLIDDIENGRKITDPNLNEVAKRWRKWMDESFDMANEVDRLSYRENYFPHIFKNEKGIQRFLKKWNKSPAFKKQRKFPTIKDALDWAKENNVDLQLVSDNPAELILMRRIAGFQHKMAKNIMQELKDAGIIKFVRTGAKGEVGYEPLTTHYFDVFFPSEKGLVLAGKWEALPEAKVVLDRYFSNGLWGKQGLIGDIFRTTAGIKNFMIALKLGFSGFHLMETGTSSFATQLSLALKKLLSGKVNVKDFGRAFVEPFLAFGKYGKDIIKAWENKEPYIIKIGNEEWDVIDLIKRGGGDLSVSKEWLYGIENRFKQAIKEYKKGHYFKGSLKMIPGLAEKISEPIMKYWVPRLKANAYMRMAEEFIRQHPKISDDKLNKALFKIWDSVDNRFGELVYDKLFWNKTLKDLLVLSQVSMGWNIGTFREFGGAANDALKILTSKAIGKEAEVLPDRLLYALSYTLAFGSVGAIITKIMTGENPKEIRDYFYPRTGYKLQDGNDERFQMPTMLKEVMGIREAYRKGGLVQGASIYAGHKLAPMFAMMYYLTTNKDYYGVQIKDPGANIEENLANYANFFWKQGLVPISWESMAKHYKRTGKLSPLPLFGFSIAPGYVVKKKIQKEIFDKYGEQLGNPVRTKQEYEKFKKKMEVKILIQNNKIEEARKKFVKLKADGVISRRIKWHTYLKRYTLPSDIRVFSMLTDERQQLLLKKMNNEEKARYYPYSKEYRRKNKGKGYHIGRSTIGRVNIK